MNQTILLDERMRIIRSMDFIVMMMQHEMAYETWILVVPDQAGEDDYMDIAEDDEMFRYVCKTFVNIVEQFGRHGW